MSARGKRFRTAARDVARDAGRVRQRQLRHYVFSRDHWRCQRCGFRFFGYGRRHGRIPTLDHIVPLTLGGRTTEENLQLLCDKCNVAKGGTAQAQPSAPLQEAAS